MKKIVVNMSGSTYEKLRFEAIKEKKDIRQIISERILYKQFDEEVEKAFGELIQKDVENILKDE